MFCFLVGIETSAAQKVNVPLPARPKIGLVLSGGSAKGIAHVGVLKVLEAEGIPIDVIAGASMGAIAGGLYAIGFSAEQLEAIVNDPSWQKSLGNAVKARDQNLMSRVSGQGVLIALPTEGTEFKIPSGVISGQEIMAMLSNWTWSFQDEEDFSLLPIPLAVVATDLRTGEAVSLKNVSLPTALRASLSIPTLFAPVEIDGKQYIDGGLSRNLPGVDAIKLGADVLIGIDVGTQLDSLNFDEFTLIDVLMHTASFQGFRSDREQRALIDILIQPDISKLTFTDFSRAEEWVRRGEAAAYAALPQIRHMMDSLGIARRYRTLALPEARSKLISRLNIEGVTGQALDFVEERLGFVFPATLGPLEISAAISEVYETGLFDLVTYHVEPLPDSTFSLVIVAEPRKTPDRVGLGVRYDYENATQILLTLALRNRLHFGSITEFRISVGKQSQFRALYLTANGSDSRFQLGFGVDYAGAPIRFFLPKLYAESINIDPTVPVLSLGLDVYSVNLLGGYAVSSGTKLSLTLKADRVRIRREIASVSTSGKSIDPLPGQNQDHSVLTVSFAMDRDTFDNRSFPKVGMKLSLSGGVGLSSSEPSITSVEPSGGQRFQYFRLDAQGYVPLNRKISLFARTALGYGAGEALPLSYHTFLGGTRPTSVLPGVFLPLYGLDAQARFGRKAYLGAVGIQWEIRQDFFGRLIANSGKTFDILVDKEKTKLPAEIGDLLREPASFGFGLEFGVRTPLGPVSLVLSSHKVMRWPELGMSFGYSF